MKINILRKIDYYFGPLVCRVFLALRLFLKTGKAQNGALPVESCKNILIIKFFGMGTILLASPALRALKKKYSLAKITILTLERNRELCGMLPPIDTVMCLKLNSILGFLTSFAGIISDVRKRDFDIVVDLEFLTCFSALVTLLVTLFKRPAVTVGFNSPLKWRNRTHDTNVAFDHSRHITKIFAKVAGSLGAEDFEPSFEAERALLLERMDAKYVEILMSADNELANAGFFVCVNINAGDLCLHRRWPKEHFAAIVNELVKRQDTAIVLIGGKEDIRYVAEFKKLLPQTPMIVNTAGKTNINSLISLFAKSDLFITNDSGPLHLAGIMGLPTISFFGPETPYLYGPLDNRHRVFYEDLYCSPCLNIYNSKISHCRNNICLKSIAPERVSEAIGNYLLDKDELSAKPGIEEKIDEVSNI